MTDFSWQSQYVFYCFIEMKQNSWTVMNFSPDKVWSKRRIVKSDNLYIIIKCIVRKSVFFTRSNQKNVNKKFQKCETQ